MKVAIYVRVSTQEQYLEGYSIPAQISLLKNYCAMFQHIVYKVYHDLGISGKNIEDRPSLLELIEDAKMKKFDCVLVWKLNRLSRKLLDILSTVDIFTQHNISFISFSEKFDTSTPVGKMTLQMLGSIAEFERNTIIENVKLGLNERFRQGLSKGSIPFGYIYENKIPVIVPDKAEQVKYLFETYNNSDGNCLTDLAEYLNLKGYKTQYNGLWSRDSVKYILSNHFYAGYVRTDVRANKHKWEDITVIKGKHEPIISEELFQAVNKKINSRKYAPIKNPDNSSLVTGLISCPLCGNKMHAHWYIKKYKKNNGTISEYNNTYYKCNNNKGRIGCKGFCLAANKIDPHIEKIIKKFQDKKFTNKLSKEINQEIKKLSKKSINTQLQKIEADLKTACEKRDRYYKLFETGKVEVEKFADKINEILITIENLETLKNNELQNNIDFLDVDIIEAWIKYIENVPSFDKMDNKDRKDFVRNIIKEVTINENKELVSVETIIGTKIYCT